MKKFLHSFVVPADIERVWNFYTDVKHLEIITPPHIRLKVLKTTTGTKLQQGTEVWIEGNLVIKSGWHSKITLMNSYVYVDEMLEGRFKTWKHTHTFERAEGSSTSGNRGGSGIGTKVIDEIEFELRYGLLGRMFEGYVYRQLEKIFAHRTSATIAALR